MWNKLQKNTILFGDKTKLLSDQPNIMYIKKKLSPLNSFQSFSWKWLFGDHLLLAAGERTRINFKHIIKNETIRKLYSDPIMPQATTWGTTKSTTSNLTFFGPPHIAAPLAELLPPHCCWLEGTPVQTFELSLSSSSPQVPPMLVEGVWPQGAFCWGCGGGWPPLRRLASHSSVPLFTEGFQGKLPEPSILLGGSGLPGMSQLVSWFTCCWGGKGRIVSLGGRFRNWRLGLLFDQNRKKLIISEWIQTVFGFTCFLTCSKETKIVLS